MTMKQAGAVLGAVVLAVAAPLLILVLLHGIDGTARAQTLLFTLNTANPQADGRFGDPVAVGDVNNDGWGDLIV